MELPVIQISALAPLENLHLRLSGAYLGTITAPGDLVSDGKVIFAMNQVPRDVKALAQRMAEKPGPGERAVIPQERAAQVFQAIAKGATKKARVLGQVERPGSLWAAGIDNVAVLCYGKGRNARYVCVNAHRLLLLQKMTWADEIRCGAPREPVLLRRRGIPVGGLTALSLEPQVR